MSRLVRSRGIRRAVLGLLMAVLLVSLAGGMASAQNTNRKLRVGDTVNGTLDAKTFVQVYTFDATKSDTITLTATSKTKGLLLALVLNDASGQTLNQVAELSQAAVTIRDFKPAADGTYYITVLRATGVQGNTPGTFSLSLSGTAATPAVATATLTDSLTISLAWTSTDDMSLEVRDPVGNAVNINNPTISTGGHLDGHVNANCQNTTANNPTETVTWPKGNIPIGSYEILVYFNKSCPQGVTPLPFALTVTADGKAQDPVRGTINAAGQVYVASFLLSAPDTVAVQPGGTNLNLDLTPFAAKIASPVALDTKAEATGTIDHTNAADAYSFTGHKGDTISVTEDAVNGGSLDSFLLLLDSSGNVLASNDDANATTRNAQIANQVLPADGTYTIVATRFALAIGGTEGSYTLRLTRGKTNVVASPTVPTAAPNATLSATLAATSDVGAGLPLGSIEASLSWNSRSDLRLWIRDPQGRSVYSDVPKIDSGGILQNSGNLNCKTANGTNPVDYIYWNTAQAPTGTYEVKVWENANCGDTVPVTFKLSVTVRSSSGTPTQVINVSNTPGPNKQVYLTTFTVDPNGNATGGNGDFVTNQFTSDITSAVQSATSIAYNQTVNGQITADTKHVVYTFTGKAGDKVRITMRARSGNIDPELFLLGSDGKTQLGFNDDANDPTLGSLDARVNYTVTKDDTYIIVATHYGVDIGGTLGNYDLQLAGPTR